MINQCTALADALGLEAESKSLTTLPPWRWLPPQLWLAPLRAVEADGDRLRPPWPDLLIASGRHSVAPALAVKRRSGGRTFCVQVQNPTVGFRNFDLIVAPEHDNLSGPNVVSTRGALHRVTADLMERLAPLAEARLGHLPRPRLAVLLGGNNAVYRFREAIATKLASELARLVREEGVGVAVTPSPRTPAAALAAIRRELDPLDGAVIWDGGGENPYLVYLAAADHLLVTSDSVNMVSEAAGTGRPVYVLELEGGSYKFAHFHRAMREAGITREFTGRLETWPYTPPDDMARVVDAVRRRLGREAPGARPVAKGPPRA